MGTSASRMIRSSWPDAMASSVAVTPPSTEFSMGTMAASADPSRTLSSAVLTLEEGMRTAWTAPGTCISAASVNVPSGPRKVYVTGDAGMDCPCLIRAEPSGAAVREGAAGGRPAEA